MQKIVNSFINTNNSKKPLLELCIRKTAVQTMVDETIVDAIIRDQWKSANKAVHTANQIEITGLGMFKISQAKIRKYINVISTRIEKAKLSLNDHTDPIKIGKIEARINSLERSLEFAKSKYKE